VLLTERLRRVREADGLVVPDAVVVSVVAESRLASGRRNTDLVSAVPE
jgi:hypothetical protein